MTVRGYVASVKAGWGATRDAGGGDCDDGM